jgi:hypothetical protein
MALPAGALALGLSRTSRRTASSLRSFGQFDVTLAADRVHGGTLWAK